MSITPERVREYLSQDKDFVRNTNYQVTWEGDKSVRFHDVLQAYLTLSEQLKLAVELWKEVQVHGSTDDALAASIALQRIEEIGEGK